MMMVRSSVFVFVLLAFLYILSASTSVSAAHTSPTLEAIDNDLTWFQEQGWESLYEEGGFDCSRMTVFFWDFLRRKHGIDADIIVNFDAEHAWICIPSGEFGDTTPYPLFTVKGVSYFFVESTFPCFVENEEHYMNLTQGAMVFDDPLEVVYFTCNGFYLSNDFRLTYPDLVKIRTILPDYTPT